MGSGTRPFRGRKGILTLTLRGGEEAGKNESGREERRTGGDIKEVIASDGLLTWFPALLTFPCQTALFVDFLETGYVFLLL